LIRLSGTLLDRGLNFRSAVLELGAHLLNFSARTAASAFWREPSEVIKTPVAGQGQNRSEPNSAPLVALRKKSKSNQQKMPEPIGLAGDHLLGLAMACSL
jgi:hypothetical protein